MPQLLDYPTYAWQVWRGARSRGEADLDRCRRADVAGYVDFSRPLTILDLANGRLRPQYAILRAQGHRVVGIDLVNRPVSSWKARAYAVARALYAKRLRLPPAVMRANALVCGDVGRLPFPDATFDLVTSVAAFEHFLDVPAVVAEVAQVLRPGGVVWAAIHVFTAPSGGHNLSFAEVPLRHVPPGVDPWDHLRRRRLPFSVPLNEWRIRDYLAVFGRHFEIIHHYCHMREGEHLLTPEIEAELTARGYTRDELTCGAYVIVARRPCTENTD
ncbi:methyltransferase domain-containing protein [Roseiflexus sp.]|uniref:methyltransferase domain-containing protein n=1 Tax=Roseiflexus sp. TaxID=2562120 RepID=UPI0021DE7658|nr:methyltransferase domain-containing protein [Roseiflexus sp.]GIV99703.1 MAG: hypothetical protein KatS3mg058_1107 [Roseiflexus sp.]